MYCRLRGDETGRVKNVEIGYDDTYRHGHCPSRSKPEASRLRRLETSSSQYLRASSTVSWKGCHVPMEEALWARCGRIRYSPDSSISFNTSNNSFQYFQYVEQVHRTVTRRKMPMFINLCTALAGLCIISIAVSMQSDIAEKEQVMQKAHCHACEGVNKREA